jgi:hypothetical protein
MWSFVWRQVCEVFWLMTMLAGLSLFSVVAAASALAIVDGRLASLMLLLPTPFT